MVHQVEAQKIRVGYKVALPGAVNLHGADISKRYFRVKGVTIRMISVVLTFDPSEDGPQELVVLRPSETVRVSGASMKKVEAVDRELEELATEIASDLIRKHQPQGPPWYGLQAVPVTKGVLAHTGDMELSRVSLTAADSCPVCEGEGGFTRDPNNDPAFRIHGADTHVFKWCACQRLPRRDQYIGPGCPLLPGSVFDPDPDCPF